VPEVLQPRTTKTADRMDTSRSQKPMQAREYWTWIVFWAQFALLAVLAIVGAFWASQAEGPGDYDTGLWLSLASVALAFMRLKQYFDAGRTDWPTFLFVDDMMNLIAAIIVFAIVALVGLFVAAGSDGSLHNAGIALFAASGLAVFLTMKRVFDKMEERH
jgi:hypothetical protein